MSAKTKIWVLHMREVILTAVFIIMGILLLLFIIVSLTNSGEETQAAQGEFTPPGQTTTPLSDSNADTILVTQQTTDALPNITDSKVSNTASGAISSVASDTLPDVTADMVSNATAGMVSDMASDTISNTAVGMGDGNKTESVNIVETNISSDSLVNIPEEKYLPGIYRTVLFLNDQTVDIEVTVDPYQITSLALGHANADIETMYPLLSPTFEDIKMQLYKTQSPEMVTYDADKKYTSLVLLEAISKALEKAALP